MKKTAILRMAAVIISMAALVSIGCSRTAEPEPRLDETEAAETAQPSPTMSEWEQRWSELMKRNDTLKWYYDKKSKRLTVKGTGVISGKDCSSAVDASPNHADTYVFDKIKELVIGEGITEIGMECFPYHLKLEKVSLPDSLQKIGREAFWRCPSLKEINIPEQVQSVGENCFYRCESLQKITLGKSVAEIGQGAFAECYNICEVEVSPENEYFVTKNGGLYREEERTLYLQYEKSAQINIEEGTERIAEFALQGNQKVEQITIPASVETIGGGAMLGCSNLKKVEFPEQSQLKEIEGYHAVQYIDGGSGEDYSCFQGCKKLWECIFPESLERVGPWTFECTPIFTSIYLGKNFKGYSEKYHTVEFGEIPSSLKEYIVSEENERFCSRDGVLYDKEMKKLLVYPPEKKCKKFTVPESVEEIFSIPTEGKLIIHNKDAEIKPRALPRKSKSLTIYGKKGSKAYRAAKKYKVRFVKI